MRNLYEYINNPNEIWLDKKDYSLIFITYLPENEIIEGRNCIKASIKIDKSNKNNPVNYIGSASRVIRKFEMTDVKRYEKIKFKDGRHSIIEQTKSHRTAAVIFCASRLRCLNYNKL